ncbi:MAG TPA: tRNA (guanosine(37)-N1)-methyltransferase TrmD [Burkholderiaceae bacterium]|nr:tRNA (guanosine(37)-N1)-methyltransferase TrmD [Burkholderiaceae bacterium]
MRFDVLTIFPEMFSALTGSGITRRAAETGALRLKLWNPRDFTQDAYRRVDDRPFGGGPGMVMLAAPLQAALDAARADAGSGAGGKTGPVLLMSPAGSPLTHRKVLQLSQLDALTIICGRYEGIDERFIARNVDEEVSIGDFVVSGGELPAMMLMDAVVRQLPGVLNTEGSATEESFADGLLDCPQFTRPEVLDVNGEGVAVPAVLMSGNHAEIARWRREQQLIRTLSRRPDLIESARAAGTLSARDEATLKLHTRGAASTKKEQG